MSFLIALVLIVHGGIHVGFLCSRSWPFEPGDAWLATALGADPDTVAGIAAAFVIVSFVAFVLAGLTAVGLLPARLWRPLVVVAAVTSAAVLVLFVTPATLPGLAIDAALLLAVGVRGWRPKRLIGGRARATRPVTI
jgi:sugar phosphate permease